MPMDSASLTVVVPVRNESKSLGSVLTSLRSSLGPKVEIIVVDDGSTDGSRAVAHLERDVIGESWVS